MNKKIGLTLVLAAILRLVSLGVNPPGLSWDEASLGYNAWSIALTGRDEHGKFLPHDAFAAFGDYKPPVYIYAAVPFVWFLGPTPLAIRLPSALAGVLAVFLTYLFTFKLFSSWGGRLKDRAELISLAAALLLAISPWHLQLSRAGIEANLAVTLVLAGATLMVYATQKPQLIPAAALFFVASLYTFNSNRVFTPLLVAGFGLIFFKTLLGQLKWAGVGTLAGLALMLPLLSFLRTPQAKLRFHEVNIFSDLDVVITANKRLEQDNWSWRARVIHNRRVGHVCNFLSHYFDHFSGEFLFARGDINPKLSVTKMGELYLGELPFLLIGIYLLLKNSCPASWLIFFWLLTAPIPAATARETPHALRALTFLPMFQVIGAVGLVELKLKRPKLAWLLVGLILVQFVFYLDYYYRFYPQEYSKDWLTAYKPMVTEVIAREQDYDRVVVTDTYGRPYIFFLVYGRIHPEEFWERGVVETDVFGFKNVSRLGKVEFGKIDSEARQGVKTLLVGRSDEFPAGAKPIKIIRFLNGEEAFWLLES